MSQFPRPPMTILPARAGAAGAEGRPVTSAVLVSATRRSPQSPLCVGRRGRPVTSKPQRARQRAHGDVVGVRARANGLPRRRLRGAGPPVCVVVEVGTSCRRSSACAPSTGMVGTSRGTHNSGVLGERRPVGSFRDGVRCRIQRRLLSARSRYDVLPTELIISRGAHELPSRRRTGPLAQQHFGGSLDPRVASDAVSRRPS